MIIVTAGPERWDVVRTFVLALLEELGSEGRDLGVLSTSVRELWERRPDRMDAVIAYADDGQREPIGLLTLSEGFAVYANGEFGSIREMYVVPHARSSGVGSKLIERAIAIARERGWSRIEVTTPELNFERQRKFYESCGFQFSGPKLKLPLTDSGA